jgi:hypothetical protein
MSTPRELPEIEPPWLLVTEPPMLMKMPSVPEIEPP